MLTLRHQTLESEMKKNSPLLHSQIEAQVTEIMLIIFVPFFVAHISCEHVLKIFGNTFDTDFVVNGSNKLKTTIFNLEILSAKYFLHISL